MSRNSRASALRDDREAAYLRYVQELAAAAPPLRPEQRDRLQVLLRPAPAAATSQAGRAAA